MPGRRMFLILPFPSSGFQLRRQEPRGSGIFPSEGQDHLRGLQVPGEEGGWASVDFWGDFWSSLWGVWAPTTTRGLAHPVGSLATSSHERLRFKIRLLANQSFLVCHFAIPCHQRTLKWLSRTQSREDNHIQVLSL